MFPIEWARITRAVNLKSGEFAYLPSLDMSRILVGKDNAEPDYTIAVMLDADVSKCTVREVKNLDGPAFAVAGYRFEGDIQSLEKLDSMDDRYGALVVSGKDISIVARPPHNAVYALIKVGELDEENPSKVPFAYRRWRLVKESGDSVVELYRKGASPA